MTINDYEKEGGFKEELDLCRTIGMAVTTLKEMLPSRPHRSPETLALNSLWLALNDLRTEICKTRDT